MHVITTFCLLSISFVLGASAATVSAPLLANFETVPPTPTGPDLFREAGPTQTIAVPNVATFTGGVVLGNATNFPAMSYATAPNSYGTASANYVPGTSPTLKSTINIALSPTYTADEVSFPLFNGVTSSTSYVVTAFDGSTAVASQSFMNVPANLSSGFRVVDLKAPMITSVTVSPTDTSEWDFAIDSFAFNESVQQGIKGVAPEPGLLSLLGFGLLGCGMLRKKLRSRLDKHR